MHCLSCRYNNKTYRIDDIAWDHTPNNTFKKGDKDVSFKSYYKAVGVIHPGEALFFKEHFSMFDLKMFNYASISNA